MNSKFPKEWRQIFIGDLGKFYGGLTGKNAEQFNAGKPFLTYMQVYLQRTSKKREVGFVFIGDDENQNKVFYGDILFTTSSETPDEIGMTDVFLESDWTPYLNSFCFGLRVKDFTFVEPSFLKYLFRGDKFRKDIRPLAQGSTRFNLSKNNLAKLNILIPPLLEQKKISSVLSSLDEVIENAQRKIDKLQDLKKATMNELLIKGIDHGEFKDSEGGRIPKSWEVYELGKLCTFTQGVQVTLDKTIRKRKDGYIRYLYINDFSSEKNLRYIKNEFPTKIVTENDLIMANTGHTAGTIFRGKHGVLSNNAFRISIKRLIKSDYLFYYLSTDNYWFRIRKLFNTAGQPHVGHSNIARLQFLCPPLNEQDNILSILHQIDKNILNNEKKLSKIKFLKKSLMQVLLTGKVRLKVN